MKTTIYTSFDCLIKFDDREEVLDKNQHLDFNTFPEKIEIYPVGKTSRPAFYINCNEKISPFYRIIEKDDKVLIFLLDGIYVQNIQIYSLNVEDKICQVEVGKESVTFICDDNKKILSSPYAISSSSCGNFYHIAYLKTQTEYGEQVFAYNVKNHNAKVLSGRQIAITDDGFIVHTSSQGYKNIQEEYIVTKDGLKIKGREFSTSPLPIFDEMIAYRFLDSVKHSDYKNALNLLSENLASSLDVNSLRSYFGNVSFFFPIDERNFFAISNKKNVLYSFSISNGKIVEISDDED